MGAESGLAAILDTTGVGDTDELFDAIIALIPNPDAAHGTGAVAGGGHLDEMSPGAAAQLRATLAAAKIFANAAVVPGV